MYDAEGRAYLDLQMWYSTANFGYRNPRLNAAAHRQLDILPQIASQHLHREKVELAAFIARDAEAKFGARGRVHFNVGGAQAIEDSLKVVRNAKDGKGFMFAFQGGYHGRTLGASAITSSYRYRRRYGHFGDRAHFVEFPYAFRGPKGMSKEEYGDYCVRNFARLFESEFHGVSDPRAGESEFAAFYAEPIQGTGGYVIPPKNFFIELKKVLDQHGILLVVDEVQMGIWRTGKLWSIEHFGVQPDVLVFGKAVTNGLNPLSGLWAREELINPEVFPPGATHSTFNANPMGTAVALETLRMAAEGDYERTVPEKGAYFLAGLQELQKRWPQIGDVDGLGLALRAELCGADGFTPDKSLLDRMVAEGLKGDLDVGGKQMGLILNVGGYYKNVITFAPSLDITYPEIDLALKLLDALLRRCVTN
jgi:4-aminobutyrate aminotransferase-like enzyme